MPAGRLLFTGGQRGPATSSASPPAGHGSGGVNNNHNNHLSNNNSNNNNNNPSPAAGEERESAATPSSDVSANGRSTPDDVHNVHREWPFCFFSLSFSSFFDRSIRFHPTDSAEYPPRRFRLHVST